MARVYISVGSNIDRGRHIRAAVSELRQRFGELTLSSVYESQAVGFDGDDFYNMVIGLDCGGLSVGEVADELHRIEDRHGRDRAGPRFSSRTLDLDLLTYDELRGEYDGIQLPREEITKNAFVLWPLAEVAPQERHPGVGLTYAEMWAAFDKDSQPLWPIPFAF